MASTYTDKIGFSNPAPGDCGWDVPWWRNQFLSDVCLGVLNSTNRVVEGGVITDLGSLNVSVSAGSANIGGKSVSWDETTFVLDGANPDALYESNWFYIDDTGAVLVIQVPPSSGDFVALAVVDVDETAVLRNHDIRAIQADASIIPSIEKILSGTDIVDVGIGAVKDDPDLGLWVHKTKATTWYNEPLNTSIRGRTRAFPKDYLYVAEAYKVTIYDLTAPDVPMWMVFTKDSGTYNMLGYNGGRDIVAIDMSYGVLSVAATLLDGLTIIDFKSDYATIRANGFAGVTGEAISERHSGFAWTTLSSSLWIVNTDCNAIAMTVLSGNDYPTIAVATDGGVSVIDGPAGKDTVVDMTHTVSSTNEANYIRFVRSGLMWVSRFNANGYVYAVVYESIPSVDSSSAPDAMYSSLGAANIMLQNPNRYITSLSVGDTIAIGRKEDGLALLKENTTTPDEGSVNYITSEYQTGGMKGDIKLATLADTTVETIGTDITTEHIINGTFDTDISDWTAGGGATLTHQSGRMRVEGDGAYAYQAVTMEIGQVYEITGDAFLGTSSNVAIYLNDTPDLVGVIAYDFSASDRALKFTYKATSTTLYVLCRQNSSGVSYVEFDNVSVKAIQNIIDNREFSSDRSWTKGTGWTISGNNAICDGSSSNLTQDDVFEQNKSYVVVYEVKNYVSGSIDFAIWGDPVAGTVRSADGIYTEVVESQGSALGPIYFRSTSFDGAITNIEIYELDIPDRSYNNNPLRVIGELEKTAVASGAELVAYSGFSANDYIEQPYNSDLDFGTGDFHIMGWIKVLSSGTYIAIERGDDGGDPTLNLGVVSGKLRAYIKVGGSSYQVLDPSSYPLDAYCFAGMYRRSGILYLSLNGVEIGSVSANVDVSSITGEGRLILGSDIARSLPLSGDMTLVRSDAGAPSAEWIKEQYQKEKGMFQPDSEITLSEDQVTCLSYNEDSNTLKVGVTDGTSSHHVDTFVDGIKIDSLALSSVPVSVDHTFDSSVIAEATQVEYNKDSVNLREL